MKIIDNDLLSMQEARILVEIACEAQKKLAVFSQKKLDEIVEGTLNEIEKYSPELSKLTYEETDCGKIEDKLVKIQFINIHLKEKLKEMKCVGIIEEDEINKTKDIGVPLGVIVAFCPETNPVSTIIYKTILAIKSGNSIIFVLDPGARQVMKKTLDILIEIAKTYGLPKNALSYLSTVSLNGTLELINQRDVSLIINSGNNEILDDIYKSGKPLIYGGAGNGPVFIEKTADIEKAVGDIIFSKNFDYGVVPGGEQSIVVDNFIAKEVREEFQKNGGYFLNGEESKVLGEMLFDKDGNFKKEFAGRSPNFIAKRMGLEIPKNTKLLISTQKYVSLDDNCSREKLCPVISFYIENDWKNACDKCIELLLNEKKGHTLIIHSKDESIIEQFALKKPVGRILVNTPGVLGSIGGTTNLFPSLTLGSGLTGRGITSENVSPMNLVYIRKVGYEVKSKEEFLASLKLEKKMYPKEKKDIKSLDNTQLFQELLKEVVHRLK